MRYEVLYSPSFSLLRLQLELGEGVRAESGAMVSMSPGLTLESGVTGGLLKGLGRMLAGESLFQTTFSATSSPGELTLAPSSIGDLVPLQLAGEGWMVTSGSFLAGDRSLKVETKVSGRGFFAGEGLFIMRVSGQGLLVLSTFGALHRVDLAPGQRYTVDSGHIVAFSESLGYEVRRVSRSIIGSLTSGEGVVADFTGPGTIYVQTRSPWSFASFISTLLPKS